MPELQEHKQTADSSNGVLFHTGKQSGCAAGKYIHIAEGTKILETPAASSVHTRGIIIAKKDQGMKKHLLGVIRALRGYVG